MLTRNDFLIGDDVVFLNHGSFGALPRVLLDEQVRWITRMERQLVVFFRESYGLLASARTKLGQYLGCEADDLVYIVNSTYGVNVAADALCRQLPDGAEILTSNHEYGACIRAWQRHIDASGKELSVVMADVPLPAPSPSEIFDRICAAVTERTKVIFLSHITAPTALILPIAEICAFARERGILTVVDGSHAPGHIPLNLAEVGADIYTANCHKWMCAPKGSGFIYVRKELQEMFARPLVMSWGVYDRPSSVSDYVDELEYIGTRDLSAFLTVPAAIEWMAANDWPAVGRTARELRRHAVERLTEIEGIDSIYADDADNYLQMGAMTLPHGTDVNDIKAWLLREHGIEIVVLPWNGRAVMRVSAHAHTRPADIDLLVSAVRAYYQK